jgi:superoxide dismutase, Fe-Mn family
VLDVRRSDNLNADDCLIVSAIHCDMTKRRWLDNLPTSKPVVVYCADGGEVSRAAAATLRSAHFNAAYLEGGIAGWRNSRHRSDEFHGQAK